MAFTKKRIIKLVLLLVAIVVIGIQFSRPERTNPPVDPQQTIEAHQQVPQPVAAILQRSCDDCHSHKTVWPFYSQIAPVSWLVADDVRIGRNNLNFSAWGSYDHKKRAKLLEEICDEVSHGGMPVAQYLIVHRSAKLSADEVKTLCDWSKTERDAVAASAPD